MASGKLGHSAAGLVSLQAFHHSQTTSHSARAEEGKEERCPGCSGRAVGAVGFLCGWERGPPSFRNRDQWRGYTEESRRERQRGACSGLRTLLPVWLSLAGVSLGNEPASVQKPAFELTYVELFISVFTKRGQPVAI